MIGGNDDAATPSSHSLGVFFVGSMQAWYVILISGAGYSAHVSALVGSNGVRYLFC